MDGAEDCTACDAGYTLNRQVCEAKTCANSGDNDGPYTCEGEEWSYDPATAVVVCPQPGGCKNNECCVRSEDVKQTTAADASTAAPSLAAMLVGPFVFFGSYY